MNIAICIIAYNRKDSLQRLLKSISNAFFNQEVTLIISVDKSDNPSVENFADAYEWAFGEKRVIKHAQNLGLREHVLSCGELVREYDALIVLEDDLTVAESFFIYAKQCVERFRDNDEIAGISLYNFPLSYHSQLPFMPLQSDSDIYLMKCAQSWGQVWMPRQWKAFKDWYENNKDSFEIQNHLPQSICTWPKSSWLKYHTRYCIEQNKFFVYPYVSFSTNNSETGTHNRKPSTLFQANLQYGIKSSFNLNPTIKYDGFFENEILYNILKYTPDELCLDYYGDKQNRERKRYWLSREHVDYKILKSFALNYKPYEYNILLDCDGDELFLYDTTIKEKNKRHKNDENFIEYSFCHPGLKGQAILYLRKVAHYIKHKVL